MYALLVSAMNYLIDPLPSHVLVTSCYPLFHIQSHLFSIMISHSTYVSISKKHFQNRTNFTNPKSSPSTPPQSSSS